MPTWAFHFYTTIVYVPRLEEAGLIAPTGGGCGLAIDHSLILSAQREPGLLLCLRKWGKPTIQSFISRELTPYSSTLLSAKGRVTT